ncbi:hypothetical protein M8C21_002559 [Ambrosia artemisiifolia]|uniref:Uncharacterized protein n=1 Tax=Ambrosia artemisiifolia TaxID=4212 RepID=A0AAD5BWZ9_AMBAR|nr:hypothetical protein M8C21_002559 [Ambrosia artemisiifolia]
MQVWFKFNQQRLLMEVGLAAKREDVAAMDPVAVKTMFLNEDEFRFCRVLLATTLGFGQFLSRRWRFVTIW